MKEELSLELQALLFAEKEREIEELLKKVRYLRGMSALEYLQRGIHVNELTSPQLHMRMCLEGWHAVEFDVGRPSWKVFWENREGYRSWEEISDVLEGRRQ